VVPGVLGRSTGGSLGNGKTIEDLPDTLWQFNSLLWIITIFHGKFQRTKWPFSIAFCLFTRGYLMVLDEFDHDLTATGMMLSRVDITIPGRYSIAN
jgi:hypothetical protein